MNLLKIWFMIGIFCLGRFFSYHTIFGAEYLIHDLGKIGYFDGSSMHSISHRYIWLNEQGQVGYRQAGEAYIWDRGKIYSLGEGFIHGLNNVGQAVGTKEFDQDGIMWERQEVNGTVQWIEQDLPTGFDAIPYGINDKGNMVGLKEADNGLGKGHMGVYWDGSKESILPVEPVRPPFNFDSLVNIRINNSDVIFGQAHSKAYIWGRENHTLTADDWSHNIILTNINDTGNVSGFSIAMRIIPGNDYAGSFIWKDGIRTTVEAPVEDVNVIVQGINDYGNMVGHIGEYPDGASTIFTRNSAVLWGNGEFYNLNDLDGIPAE